MIHVVHLHLKVVIILFDLNFDCMFKCVCVCVCVRFAYCLLVIGCK